jgi:hypothetical protein
MINCSGKLQHRDDAHHGQNRTVTGRVPIRAQTPRNGGHSRLFRVSLFFACKETD